MESDSAVRTQTKREGTVMAIKIRLTKPKVKVVRTFKCQCGANVRYGASHKCRNRKKQH